MSVLERIKGLTAFLPSEPKIPEQPEDQLLEDLQALHALFSTSKNWTKGTLERRRTFGSAYCMMGGIGLVTELKSLRWAERDGLAPARTRALVKAVARAAGIKGSSSKYL